MVFPAMTGDQRSVLDAAEAQGWTLVSVLDWGYGNLMAHATHGEYGCASWLIGHLGNVMQVADVA